MYRQLGETHSQAGDHIYPKPSHKPVFSRLMFGNALRPTFAVLASASILTFLGGCGNNTKSSKAIKAIAAKDAALIEKLASTDPDVSVTPPSRIEPGVDITLYAFPAGNNDGTYYLDIERISGGAHKGKLTGVILDESSNTGSSYGVSFFSGADNEPGITSPNSASDNWSIGTEHDPMKLGESVVSTYTNFVKSPVYDNDRQLDNGVVSKYAAVASALINAAAHHNPFISLHLQ